jgi:hypothetical protein
VAHVTAQEVFATMMKTEMAPALRALGFQGSGQRFALQSETHWAQIGFQKSAWSDREEILFTVNVQCVSRAAWDEARGSRAWLPKRPSPNSAYPGGGWWERIGRLANREDTWWHVNADRPTDPITREVIGLIRERALPALRERMA